LSQTDLDQTVQKQTSTEWCSSKEPGIRLALFGHSGHDQTVLYGELNRHMETFNKEFYSSNTIIHKQLNQNQLDVHSQ